MNLPEICPKCGLSFRDGDVSYIGRGVQYCVGDILEVKGQPFGYQNEDSIMVDLNGSGDDWRIDPYQITCSECSCQLFEKTIIINEEQFFVEKGKE